MLSVVQALSSWTTNRKFKIFVESGKSLKFLSSNRANWVVETYSPDIFTRYQEIKPYLRGDGLDLPHKGINKRAELFFKQHRIDVVIFPFPNPLSFECGLDYVMAIHDLQHRLQPEFPEVSAEGEWQRREYLFRNAVRFAEGILVDSEVGKEDVLACYGNYIRPEQVYPLPFTPTYSSDLNQLSDDDKFAVQKKYRLPQRYFFYPAQFWLHKNHARLVQALHHLKVEHQIEAPLILTGSNSGPKHENRDQVFRDCMLLADRLGVKNQVYYLGYVPDEDMPALYAMATALAFPTFFGPANIPVLEAWAFDCPVLTSDIRGIREQVGNAALLADPKDMVAMAGQLKRLWLDQALRQTLIENGRINLGSCTTSDFNQRLYTIIDQVSKQLEKKDPARPAATASRSSKDTIDAYLVSAIVSTYNAERFIRGCLQDLVDQTLYQRGELEIIVIDSNSPQNERAIVEEFQQRYGNILYVRTEEREMLYAAWNRGAKLARGKYLTNANTDDRHRPDALELLAHTLERFPEFGLVYADTLITTVENETFEHNSATRRYEWLDYNLGIGLSNFVVGPQPVWRREVHQTVGYFDPSLEIAGDSKFFLRVARRCGAVHLHETLGLFYEDEKTISGTKNQTKTIREVLGFLRPLRENISLEEIYPALKDYLHDPAARTAALFDYSNLCALSPYTDLELAVKMYTAALERDELRPEIINNLGVVLFCANHASQAKELMQSMPGLPAAQTNLRRMQRLERQNEKALPIHFDMLQLEHPVVYQARRSCGLSLNENGTLIPTPECHPTFWDVYLDPKGTSVSDKEKQRFTFYKSDLSMTKSGIEPTKPLPNQAAQLKTEATQQKVRILLGPWDKSQEWIGQIEDADLVVFGQDAPLPYQFHQDSFDDLLARLPAGWQPDVFISWQPHLYAIPSGWEQYNLPAFAVIVDWQLFGLLDGNLDWLHAFDSLFLDRGGVEFLEKQGFERVWPFLPSSFDPALHYPDPTAEKIYDISFAGALAHPIHRARSRWLSRVSRLAECYHIAFFDWTLGPEQYARIMQQSRIIFNHTYRGELNIRCFEAMASGALLFLEEGNLDAVGHFEDGVHYVSYNETNYREKLDYYLSHEAERQRLAESGWRQVQHHTNTAHLNWLVGRIKPLLDQPTPARRAAWTPRQQGINQIINFYAPVTPVRAQAAHRAWAAARAVGDEPAWLETALAAVELGLAKGQSGAEQAASIELIIQRLQQAIRLQPEWVWPLVNLGQLLAMVGQKEQAVRVLQSAIAKLNLTPAQATAQFGPYLPYDYDHFMVAWLETNVQLGRTQENRATAWSALLEARCQEILGNIYAEQEQLDLAKVAFQRAIELRPDIGKFHLLFAEVTAQSGQYDEALAAAQRAMQIDALDLKAWLLVAKSLYHTRAYADCIKFCDGQLTSLKAFPNLQAAAAPLQKLRYHAQQMMAEQASAGESNVKPSGAPQYYQFSRPEVQALVPLTARRILDVGCAGGALGKALKDRQNCEVTGIEYVPAVAEQARTGLDKVYSGDVNEIALTLPKDYFEAIILADVLEHLPDPATTLARLLPTLTLHGKIIISIPNMRHWSVVKGLLEGQWEYEEAGLLDRTHLRFFTRASFEKLLHQVGLKPVSVGATHIKSPSIPHSVVTVLQHEGLNVSTLAQESQVYQWLYVAEPVTAPKATQDLTSIIILTHNQLDHTKLCLQTLEQHTPQPHELILVDNGSTDGTVPYLRHYAAGRDHIRLIENADNRGFAAGNNQGLAIAQGDYVVLLNNDTVVTADWLARLLNVFEQYPDTGIVGPVSNYVSGPQQVAGTTYQTVADMHQFAQQWATDHAGQSQEFYRVVGFCLLAKRTVIDRIGGLDEQFGRGNFEDDDFCVRAALAGFKARIARDVFIHHTGNQTFRAAGIDYKQSLEHNWDIFKAKWQLPSSLPYGADYYPYLKPIDSSRLYIPLTTPSSQPPPDANLHPPAAPPRLKTDQQTNEPSDQQTIQKEDTMTNNDILTRMIESAQAAEQWSQAIQLLQEAVKYAGPGSEAALLWNSLGYSYFKTGQFDQAETAFMTGLQADPVQLNLLYNLAELYQQQGVYDQATAYLNRILRLDPDDLPALLLLGQCSLELGALDVAQLAYQRVKDLAPETPGIAQILVELDSVTLPAPPSLTNGHSNGHHSGDAVSAAQAVVTDVLAKGQTALQQGDFETAAREFAWVTAQYPELAAGYMALGSTFLALGRNQAALSSLRRVTELLPDLANGHNQLGLALCRLGYLPEAETAFTQARQLDPRNIEFLLNLADLYRGQHRFDEASPLIKAALDIDPEHPEALVSWGLLNAELGNWQEAQAVLAKLPGTVQNHPGVTALKQLLAARQTEAELQPLSLPALKAQAQTAQIAGNWPRAIELLQELTSLPQSAAEVDLWNSLGYCYTQIDRLAEAEAAFKTGLTFNPNQLDLLHNMADLYLRQEVYDQATAYLNRALKVEPDDVGVLLTLGNVAVELGDYEAGRLAFQRVQTLAPETQGVDEVLSQLQVLV
jgi:GT2 family glycosyltransferase/Flp pilus assembly protein TadD/glycosyltransferase involved in cell wall biosynthesis/2-polyprenyl-3-methyl-5-hydroxy-6-metoxy-1,4-benzoquinol methylase